MDTLTDASSVRGCETSLFARGFDLFAEAAQVSRYKTDDAVYGTFLSCHIDAGDLKLEREIHTSIHLP